ncbi:MAG: nitrate/nitrite transport system ATP-binding protein [Rubritalea sp.]|jgi:nitrate/nitrite transport system ATP-binding protein
MIRMNHMHVARRLMPWMTAHENVMLGVKNVYPHVSKQERNQIVEYALSIVGLGDEMKKFPREMSGGMQQRVGIARAIALQPRVLLLDEPFGRLDLETARKSLMTRSSLPIENTYWHS